MMVTERTSQTDIELSVLRLGMLSWVMHGKDNVFKGRVESWEVGCWLLEEAVTQYLY